MFLFPPPPPPPPPPPQQQQQHQQTAVNAAEEKMSALKKVYAEILLNMAKESAARILASESKAMHFQQSLASTKEEAVQTLVGLKRIMDAKVSKVEHVSSSQLRRIQELESQLSESENTIKGLKKELEKLNNDLHKIKEKLIEEPDKHGVAALHNEVPCEENGKVIPDSMPSSSGSDVGSDAISKKSSQPDTSQQLSAHKKCCGNCDISPLMVGKEPELFRNGCTHRIRASEQNSSTSGEMDEKSPQGPSIVFTNNMNQKLCSIKDESEMTCTEIRDGSNEVAVKSTKCENGQRVRFSRRLSSRNCRSRYATCRESVQADQESSKLSADGNLQRDLHSQSSPQLLKCENVEETDECAFVAERNAQNNCEKSEDHGCKPTFKKAHVSPVKPSMKACETNGTSPRMIGGRVVKYTFHRKRLKHSSSNDGNISHENTENNLKRRMLDVARCSAEAKNPNPVLDSSQESCRIAQVARQLISLSEKR